jgi:hypothetical protein
MKKQGAFDGAADILNCEAMDCEVCSCPPEYRHRDRAKRYRLAARLLRVAGRAQTCEGSNLYMEGEMVKLADIIHRAQKLQEKSK